MTKHNSRARRLFCLRCRTVLLDSPRTSFPPSAAAFLRSLNDADPDRLAPLGVLVQLRGRSNVLATVSLVAALLWLAYPTKELRDLVAGKGLHDVTHVLKMSASCEGCGRSKRDFSRRWRLRPRSGGARAVVGRFNSGAVIVSAQQPLAAVCAGSCAAVQKYSCAHTCRYQMRHPLSTATVLPQQVMPRHRTHAKLTALRPSTRSTPKQPSTPVTHRTSARGTTRLVLARRLVEAGGDRCVGARASESVVPSDLISA